MKKNPPTIKGIFVMSHIRALEDAKGRDAVLKLVERFGKSVRYTNIENVPVSDEVKIIEYVLDLMSEKPVPRDKRAFVAGKLHFKNFSETPLGELVLSIFSFKKALIRAPWIAELVFRGVEFASASIGEKSVRITMKNNDYPLDHFQGFFQAWLEYAGYVGKVSAEDCDDAGFAYTIQWK